MIPYDHAELAICLSCDNFDGTASQERHDISAAEANELLEADAEVLDWCWSLFWHLKEGGVECACDISRHDEAGAQLLLQAMEEFTQRHKDDP